MRFANRTGRRLSEPIEKTSIWLRVLLIAVVSSLAAWVFSIEIEIGRLQQAVATKDDFAELERRLDSINASVDRRPKDPPPPNKPKKASPYIHRPAPHVLR